MSALASMDEFEALLNESFERETPEEGTVVKGKVIAVENGQAIIDVGFKVEGRVDIKEFATPGKPSEIAVGDEVEVHLDSGIRSGQDVLKALALGAKGTMIGRAFVYGLGAMGQKGVTTALEVIQKELDTTMALCGERNVADLGRHNLLVPEGFEGRWQD